MSGKPIVYFNRHSGKLEQEAIYGEDSLRWVYGSPLGKLALHTFVKRAIFSRFYGWLMDRPSSRDRVAPFIAKYGLDEAEFAAPTASFGSFNEFFSRKLRPEARPIDASSSSLVFPADGRHLLVEPGQDFMIKGTSFDVSALIGCDPGPCSVLISRLCPTDYHRFHFPVDAVAGEPRRLIGPLYSVSPLALIQRPSILWENERCVTELTLASGMKAYFVEVGATCVGKIVHTSSPGRINKGQEKGTFLFGGSTVVVVLPSGSVRWAEDLCSHSAEGREIYAKMGELAGSLF